MTTNVLVVEDDFALRSALTASLEVSGYKVHTCENAENAVMFLAGSTPSDMVITDIQMGNMSGIDLLKHIRKNDHALPVILMTAYGDISDAVEAMRLGACDYLQKPFEAEMLTDLIEQYLPSFSDENVIINDPASQKIYQYAKRIAGTDSSVLLSGESGAGKEVMAKYIHQSSNRANNKFVAINCAAIPENMLESTLFGFEKGAFTGAHQSSAGKFEQAQGGTLLLDEISEMPLSLQAKILRVIQEKEVERLGGKKIIKLDVRIIVTTNRNLKQEVAEQRFREDLYYRLNVFPIHCLSLRERPSDILPLAELFLQKYDLVDARGRLSFSQGAKLKLVDYSWPGNVRELDNLIQRAAVLSSSSRIEAEDLLIEGVQSVGAETAIENINQSNNLIDEIGMSDESSEQNLTDNQLGNDMRNHEFRLIIESLAKCQGKKKDVAEMLGISARTLRYKIARMRDAGYEIPDKRSFA
ncbi:MAG: sigma-54 dependent transcriptional regulator [Kangiellaceae bacterium]|nr:sigma-54 dependent transcriptional regulator [Kangiellaceae bacterium]